MLAQLAFMLDDVINTFPITSSDLSGVTSAFNSAVQVAVPIGVGIMSVMMGIRFVPKIIKRFGA